MSLRLIQIVGSEGDRQLLSGDDPGAFRVVEGFATTYDLAREAIRTGQPLAALLASLPQGAEADVAAALAEGRVLAPIDHPDATHLHVTGTGLTHLGSAEGRNKMHAKAEAEGEAALTDSMKMFLMGVKGGKPADGEVGAQPEWFYKGNGHVLAGPTEPLQSPAFALDGGEEPEMAGIYIIGDDGTPFRLGFAMANEFSDHVTEKGNYLWLAHSKLRPASLGAEIRTGDLPHHIQGMARIRRGNEVIWEKPFLSGEDNMSHTIANLEHHHFKYGLFRQPGDVHVHCFGTATASFADGIATQAGDVFEIEADAFRYPLANPLKVLKDEPVVIKSL